MPTTTRWNIRYPTLTDIANVPQDIKNVADDIEGVFTTYGLRGDPGPSWFVQGVVGDGVTDNTAAIDTAISAAATAGGGAIYLPGGTIMASRITLKPKVYLCGAGPDATVLKQIAGSNQDFVISNSFHTLSSRTAQGFSGTATTGAGTSASGIDNFGIMDLTIDGNLSGNSVGWALSIYGNAFYLERIVVRLGKSGGLWSEYANTNSPGGANFEEACVSNFKVHSNSGPGIVWDGPHDSMWNNGIVFENSNPTSGGTSWTYDGITVLSKGNALVASQVHSWGGNQRFAWNIKSDTCHFTSCIGEGASGGCQVRIRGNKTHWIGGEVYRGQRVIQTTGGSSYNLTTNPGTLAMSGSISSFFGSGLLYFPTVGVMLSYTGKSSNSFTGIQILQNPLSATSIPAGSLASDGGIGFWIGDGTTGFGQNLINSRVAAVQHGLLIQGATDTVFPGGSSTYTVRDFNTDKVFPSSVDSPLVNSTRLASTTTVDVAPTTAAWTPVTGASAEGVIGPGVSNGFVLAPTGDIAPKNVSLFNSSTLSERTPAYYGFWFDPADYSDNGYVATLQLRGRLVTNNVAPGVSGTFALYPIATWLGASGEEPSIATLGTIVSGSSISTATLSSGLTPVTVTTTFTAPSTAGWYVLTFTPSSPTAAGSYMHVESGIQMKRIFG